MRRAQMTRSWHDSFRESTHHFADFVSSYIFPVASSSMGSCPTDLCLVWFILGESHEQNKLPLIHLNMRSKMASRRMRSKKVKCFRTTPRLLAGRTKVTRGWMKGIKATLIGIERGGAAIECCLSPKALRRFISGNANKLRIEFARWVAKRRWGIISNTKYKHYYCHFRLFWIFIRIQ